MKKKLISIFLCLCMVLTVLSENCISVQAIPICLRICGRTISSGQYYLNGDTMGYPTGTADDYNYYYETDGTNNVLHLKNAIIQSGNGVIIDAENIPLVIDYSGDNIIEASVNVYDVDVTAIYSNNKLTFEGNENATLTVSAYRVVGGENECVTGIYGDVININSGDMKICSNSSIVQNNAGSTGIYGRILNVNGGNTTVSAVGCGTKSYGVSINESISVNDGVFNCFGSKDACYLENSKISVNTQEGDNGVFYAIGDQKAICKSSEENCSINLPKSGYNNEEIIKITGATEDDCHYYNSNSNNGTLDLTSQESDIGTADSLLTQGYWYDSSEKTLFTDGAYLNYANDSDSVYAVKLPDNAKVITTGFSVVHSNCGDNAECAYAVSCLGDITLDGTGNLLSVSNAYGNTINSDEKANGIGISAAGNLNIINGNIFSIGYATGQSGNTHSEVNGHGLWSDTNIQISGGSVTSIGIGTMIGTATSSNNKTIISGDSTKVIGIGKGTNLGYGIYSESDDISVTDASVSLLGTGNEARTITTEGAGCNISIEESNINLGAYSLGGFACGVLAPMVLTVNNSTLNVAVNAKCNNDFSSFGLYSMGEDSEGNEPEEVDPLHIKNSNIRIVTHGQHASVWGTGMQSGFAIGAKGYQDLLIEDSTLDIDMQFDNGNNEGDNPCALFTNNGNCTVTSSTEKITDISIKSKKGNAQGIILGNSTVDDEIYTGKCTVSGAAQVNISSYGDFCTGCVCSNFDISDKAQLDIQTQCNDGGKSYGIAIFNYSENNTLPNGYGNLTNSGGTLTVNADNSAIFGAIYIDTDLCNIDDLTECGVLSFTGGTTTLYADDQVISLEASDEGNPIPYDFTIDTNELLVNANTEKIQTDTVVTDLQTNYSSYKYARIVKAYEISLTPDEDKIFDSAVEGYSTQDPYTVSVTNEGTFPTGDLTVELSGTNEDCFSLSTDSIESIDVDGTDNFSVVPKTGLTAGTYTATVTIYNTTNGISKSFDVSFKVNAVYQVSYNTNGASSGSTPIDNSNYLAGDSVSVKNNTGNLQKTGYSFSGWNTQADGNGTDYAAGSSFTIMANTNLYALWTPESYTVTYNDNGATTEHSNGDDNYTIETTSFTLPTTAPIKIGYNFAGWKVKTPAEGGIGFEEDTQYAADDTTVTLNGAYGNINLSAKWNAKPYTVTLDKNGGSSDGSVTATYNSTELTDISTPVNNGYTLNGFYTTAVGGVKVINPNGTLIANVEGYTDANGKWIKDASVTLYAQWSANTYTITLDKNGGASDGSATATINSAQLTNMAAAVNNGYTLNGYYTTPTSGIKVVNSNGTFVSNVAGYTDANGKWIKDASVTLYAQWSANTYAIALDKNGGSSDGSATATYKSTELTIISAAVNNGYTLNGYYTTAISGVKVINPNGTLIANVAGYTDASGKWIKDASVTLYAQWSANTYAITLDKNGGSSDGSATATINSAELTNMAAAVNNGYTLNGYYTTPTSGIKVINSNGTLVSNVAGYTDANGKWIKDGNTTLYAKWSAIPPTIFTITVQNDGHGTATASNQTAVAGKIVTLIATPNSGYKFKEWQVINGEVSVVNNTFTMPNRNVVVKAVFEIIKQNPVAYHIIKGANSNWIKNSDGTVTITGDGALKDFISVKIDGAVISSDNYTAIQDNTKIILKKVYLDSLSSEEHTFQIVWKYGSASTKFTVNEEDGNIPKTGDSFSNIPLVILILASGAGIVANIFIKKRKAQTK